MASDATLQSAIELIASVEGLLMDPESLAEDIVLLDAAFPEDAAFAAAVLSTKRALEQLVAGSLTPASLKHELDGWQSYHFQHERRQGAAADMRIVFRASEKTVHVKGFGHRSLPADIYRRLTTNRT